MSAFACGANDLEKKQEFKQTRGVPATPKLFILVFHNVQALTYVK